MSLEVSAVAVHAEYFENGLGVLEYDAMNAIQENIGSSGYLKSLVASDAIIKLLENSNEKNTGQNIALHINPAGTGLWTNDGQVDEERFELLRTFALTRDSCETITKSAFYRFYAKVHENDTPEEQKAINSWVTSARVKQSSCPFTSWLRFPITWKQITYASIERLFDDFSDVLWVNEPTFTFERLHLFYADSQDFFKIYETTPKEELYS